VGDGIVPPLPPKRSRRSTIAGGHDGEGGGDDEDEWSSGGDDGAAGVPTEAAAAGPAPPAYDDVEPGPHLPRTSLLLSLDQVRVVRLLRRLYALYRRRFAAAAAATAESCISPAEAAWLYALFARLEPPLHADVAAVVRNYFQLCRAQRRALTAAPLDDALHTETLAGIATLQTVTGVAFSQRLPGED